MTHASGRRFVAAAARTLAASALAVALAPSTAARAAIDERELAQIERELGVAEGDLTRVEEQYRKIPDVFAIDDRVRRASRGSIYHLSGQYARASLILFGAVEPQEGEKPAVPRALATYHEAVFFLADSLQEVGNGPAAKTYYEGLLATRGHDFHDDAIRRLMQIDIEQQRPDEADRHWAAYLQQAGKKNIPGETRYMRGRMLVFAGRDAEAIAEFDRIRAGDAYDLRAQYLRGAMLVRTEKLDDALAVFNGLVTHKAVARADREVIELAHIARGRLYYELDRLDEAVEAYQSIGYDSKHLTTMLYEATLTFVRRGQLAWKGNKDDGLTEGQRHDRARREYGKALAQLSDLRALEPDSVRASDYELLAANLLLQRQDFEKAETEFLSVAASYRSTDAMVQGLLADPTQRARILHEFLSLGSGGLDAEAGALPEVARRAARGREVSEALRVFSEIDQARSDVDETLKKLATLDRLLSPDNPTRTELFRPLQSGVERSTSLANAVASLRARASSWERATTRPEEGSVAAFEELSRRRTALSEKISALPRTVEDMTRRRERLDAQAEQLAHAIHELELLNDHLGAEVTALDYMLAPARATGAVTSAELMRGRVRELRAEIERNRAAIDTYSTELGVARREILTAGGRGSGDESLREELLRAFSAEHEILRQARSARGTPQPRLDALVARLDTLTQRNEAFRARLDAAVEEQAAGARAMLARERAGVEATQRRLAEIDASAVHLREETAMTALTRVRDGLNRTVLRADVGVADTAFARKQADTDKIGQLTRARAAELTDLTQAFADLTKDDAP